MQYARSAVRPLSGGAKLLSDPWVYSLRYASLSRLFGVWFGWRWLYSLLADLCYSASADAHSVPYFARAAALQRLDFTRRQFDISKLGNLFVLSIGR